MQENIVFLGLIVLVFIFGMYGLVKTPQKTSVSENRSLTQFSHFTVSDFLSGKFQDNFEKALSDQFAFSEKIRVKYGEVINNLPDFGIDNMICHNRYIILKGSQYTNAVFNCEDYLMAPPAVLSKETLNVMDANIEKYNHVNNLINTYYYYFDESNIYDFTIGEKIIDIKNLLRERMKGNYTLSSLHYNGYDEYKNYFYKTDHHLNHNGQYQAYQDIVKMMGIKKPLAPNDLVNNHEYFFGSRAKDVQIYDYLEEFEFYNYDLPKHDSFINRKEKQYGHYADYIKHNYTYKRSFNFYGWVYGGDNGEVLFDYHRPEKENLLIISNSFDNPIAPLIAQYYNKTFAVDLRHYKSNLKEDFEFSKYIKDNKIDKVLFIMSSRFIFDKNSNVGLEK